MRSLRKDQSGFTLIELLIVIVIVAILAAVGLSLLTGNTDAARLSEGVSGLGTVRTQMRARLAQDGKYPSGTGFAATDPIVASGIGFNTGDLCGRYFGDASYTWGVSVPVVGTTFCAKVAGLGADTVAGCPTGPVKGSAVATTVTRSMDQNGDIYPCATCSAGCARIN